MFTIFIKLKSKEKTMEVKIITKEQDEEIQELKEEQKYQLPRSTVEMLEQTLQIA